MIAVDRRILLTIQVCCAAVLTLLIIKNAGLPDSALLSGFIGLAVMIKQKDNGNFWRLAASRCLGLTLGCILVPCFNAYPTTSIVARAVIVIINIFLSLRNSWLADMSINIFFASTFTPVKNTTLIASLPERLLGLLIGACASMFMRYIFTEQNIETTLKKQAQSLYILITQIINNTHEPAAIVEQELYINQLGKDLESWQRLLAYSQYSLTPICHQYMLDFGKNVHEACLFYKNMGKIINNPEVMPAMRVFYYKKRNIYQALLLDKYNTVMYHV